MGYVVAEGRSIISCRRGVRDAGSEIVLSDLLAPNTPDAEAEVTKRMVKLVEKGAVLKLSEEEMAARAQAGAQATAEVAVAAADAATKVAEAAQVRAAAAIAAVGDPLAPDPTSGAMGGGAQRAEE